MYPVFISIMKINQIKPKEKYILYHIYIMWIKKQKYKKKHLIQYDPTINLFLNDGSGEH